MEQARSNVVPVARWSGPVRSSYPRPSVSARSLEEHDRQKEVQHDETKPNCFCETCRLRVEGPFTYIQPKKDKTTDRNVTKGSELVKSRSFDVPASRLSRTSRDRALSAIDDERKPRAERSRRPEWVDPNAGKYLVNNERRRATSADSRSRSPTVREKSPAKVREKSPRAHEKWRAKQVARNPFPKTSSPYGKTLLSAMRSRLQGRGRGKVRRKEPEAHPDVSVEDTGAHIPVHSPAPPHLDQSPSPLKSEQASYHFNKDLPTPRQSVENLERMLEERMSKLLLEAERRLESKGQAMLVKEVSRQAWLDREAQRAQEEIKRTAADRDDEKRRPNHYIRQVAEEVTAFEQKLQPLLERAQQSVKALRDPSLHFLRNTTLLGQLSRTTGRMVIEHSEDLVDSVLEDILDDTVNLLLAQEEEARLEADMHTHFEQLQGLQHVLSELNTEEDILRLKYQVPPPPSDPGYTRLHPRHPLPTTFTQQQSTSSVPPPQSKNRSPAPEYIRPPPGRAPSPPATIPMKTFPVVVSKGPVTVLRGLPITEPVHLSPSVQQDTAVSLKAPFQGNLSNDVAPLMLQHDRTRNIAIAAPPSSTMTHQPPRQVHHLSESDIDRILAGRNDFEEYLLRTERSLTGGLFDDCLIIESVADELLDELIDISVTEVGSLVDTYVEAMFANEFRDDPQ